MATFAFKPQYTYKPTPPRSKSTATRHKPAPEQSSILNKLQHIKSSSASLSTLRPAADGDGGYRPRIRGTGTVYGRSDKANDDENDDDDRDLPTIEELLLTKLQEQGFTTEDRVPDKTGGVEEAAADERAGSIDHHGSALGDNSGGSTEDPIMLQGDGDSSASEAEDNNNALRAESAAAPSAGLFDSPDTAIDSTTPALPCSSDGWHNIDDFPETVPRLPLAEQGASMLNSIHPHIPSPRLSSEPLHDSISIEGLRYARSEATTSSSSPLPRHCRASPETQLSQEGRLYTGRVVADEHRLVNAALDTFPFEEAREQQKDEGNGEDVDERSQQEVNGVALVVIAERTVGRPRLTNGRQSLPSLDLSPESSHNEARSRSVCDSDDELNSSDSAGDDEKKPRPAKRKQLSSSHDGPTRKKRRRPLQESSSRQRRPLSEPYRHYPKSHSPVNQRPRVATSSSAEGRLPSPAPSMPQSINTTMSLSDSSLGRLFKAALPTLTEITFRPHSAHCYSFTAVVRDGCDGRGVSLAKVIRLIASTGHVGKIDDFTIKPIEQHSYLLSGFSRHTSSQSSPGGGIVPTIEAGRIHRNTTRTGLQEGRAVDAGALASRRCEPSISDSDGGLSDSDSEPSSDDNGCSSGDEQGRSSTSKHSRWDDIDEQRLLAYKKEDKSWDWIFKKFPGRTPAAVRTRWTMVQRKVK